MSEPKLLSLREGLDIQNRILKAIESGLVAKPDIEVYVDLCYPIHPLFGPNHLTAKQSAKWLHNYKLIFGAEYVG